MVLQLELVQPSGRADPLPFTVSELVLGGYTARSAEIRDQHIEELRELGIEPPVDVPAFWPVSRDLVSTESRLRVQGNDTSGEVEFVLFFAPGGPFLGLGSDQTDRHVERTSIPRSKQVCGKVVAPTVVRLDDVRDRFDDIVIASSVRDAESDWEAYQEAALSTVLPPETLVECCFGGDQPRAGAVLMSGTVPLLDGVTRYAKQFRGSMRIPEWPEELVFHYTVDPVGR